MVTDGLSRKREKDCMDFCRSKDSDDSDEGTSEAITTLSPELRWKPLGVGESPDKSGANKESVEVRVMRGAAIHRPGWKAGCAGARWIQMSGLVRCTTARSECATCRSMESAMERGD